MIQSLNYILRVVCVCVSVCLCESLPRWKGELGSPRQFIHGVHSQQWVIVHSYLSTVSHSASLCHRCVIAHTKSTLKHTRCVDHWLPSWPILSVFQQKQQQATDFYIQLFSPDTNPNHSIHVSERFRLKHQTIHKSFFLPNQVVNVHFLILLSIYDESEMMWQYCDKGPQCVPHSIGWVRCIQHCGPFRGRRHIDSIRR